MTSVKIKATRNNLRDLIGIQNDKKKNNKSFVKKTSKCQSPKNNHKELSIDPNQEPQNVTVDFKTNSNDKLNSLNSTNHISGISYDEENNSKLPNLSDLQSETNNSILDNSSMVFMLDNNTAKNDSSIKVKELPKKRDRPSTS